MDPFDRLEKLANQPRKIRPLTVMESALEWLGRPELSYPTILVGGTNGKGSVTTKIAAALSSSGYRVGLYTSPHLLQITERIVIYPDPIDREELGGQLERLFDLTDGAGLELSFFELLTLAAFQLFARRAVDVAVVEVGLGGRCDATNLVRPLLAVVTSIGWDHQDLLGPTLDAIAAEKAAIAKSYAPLLLGPTAKQQVLREAPAAWVEQIVGEFSTFDEENSAVAKRALELVHRDFPKLSVEAIEKGISVRPFCRYEQRGKVLFDVAHNLEGLTRLFEWIEREHLGQPIALLWAVSRDKELQPLAELVARRTQLQLLPQATTPRLRSPEELAAALTAAGSKEAICLSSVEEGLITLQEQWRGVSLVAGSFYLVAEALSSQLLFGNRHSDL